MWIWISKKITKFHAKRLNRSENIPKSFRGGGLLCFETPCTVYTATYCLHTGKSWTKRFNSECSV